LSAKSRGLLDRSKLVVISILLVFTPVVLLVITLGFLVTAQGLDPAEISVLELIELYLIELALFAAFGYLLYRLLIHSVENHLPQIIDRLEGDEEPRQRSNEPWGSARTERDSTRPDSDADDAGPR
jgi:hypothetical protein